MGCSITLWSWETFSVPIWKFTCKYDLHAIFSDCSKLFDFLGNSTWKVRQLIARLLTRSWTNHYQRWKITISSNKASRSWSDQIPGKSSMNVSNAMSISSPSSTSWIIHCWLASTTFDRLQTTPLKVEMETEAMHITIATARNATVERGECQIWVLPHSTQ